MRTNSSLFVLAALLSCLAVNATFAQSAGDATTPTGNTNSVLDAQGNITFSIYPPGGSNAGTVKLTTNGNIGKWRTHKMRSGRSRYYECRWYV